MPCFSDPEEAMEVEAALSLSSSSGCNFRSCLESIQRNKKKKKKEKKRHKNKLVCIVRRNSEKDCSTKSGNKNKMEAENVNDACVRKLKLELKRTQDDRDMYKKLYLSTEEGKKKKASFEEWLKENQ